MSISRATTAWTVSGAVGLSSLAAGVLLSQAPGDAAPAEPRPAVTVIVSPSVTPSAISTPSEQPTRSAEPRTAPSPVTPPSPETPD